MKRTDIQTGAVYTDGKNRFRTVTGEGYYPLYSGQMDADCIEYTQRDVRTTRGKTRVVDVSSDYPRNRRSPLHHHITRASFATWAKRLATEDEIRTITKEPA